MTSWVLGVVVSILFYSTAVHVMRAYGVPYWAAFGSCVLAALGGWVQREFCGRRCATGEEET